MTRKPPLNIAREVKALCKDLGITHSELARRCGLTQPTISNIIKDRHEPRVSTLREIAEGTGRTLNVGNANGKIFSKRKK